MSIVDLYDRWKKGKGRLEEIVARREKIDSINSFFQKQDHVTAHSIVDDKEWIVDVEGSVILRQEDLHNGELFFKLGNVSGDVICHCREIKPSVIPMGIGGSILFGDDKEKRDDKKEDGPIGMNTAVPELKEEKGNAKNTKSCLTQAQPDDKCANCPYMNGEDADGYFDDRMQYNVKKDPTKESLEKEFEKLLWDSVNYNLPFDVQGIVERFNKRGADKEYRLRLDITRDKHTKRITKCDIFVSDSDAPLDLQANCKCIYLTYLLYEEGVHLYGAEIDEDFKTTMKNIHKQLPGSSQLDKESMKDKGVKGQMGDGVLSTSTLNPIRSNIKKALEALISNPKIVKEFCIEGRATEAYKIARTTPEIRQQIRDEFGL